jgi:GT2 family glycosyltransferase
MTASYEIPPSHGAKARFRSKPVDPERIHVVIPTFNDWDGLKKSLESLHLLNPSPLGITVVDDNRFKNEPGWFKEYRTKYPRVQLAPTYEDNRGPAYARNIGFGFPVTHDFSGILSNPGRPKVPRAKRREWREDSRLKFEPMKPREFRWEGEADWYYFTDNGCEHAKDLFQQFAQAWKECGDSCVAISGPIQGVGDGLINRYMTEQGILNPPMTNVIYDISMPQAIVTANALVSAMAFSYVGGFDETFKAAAGEDLDLGLRLRRLGVIGWAERAVVRHQFAESNEDFIRRFRRYGAGNRQLEVKHHLPSLRARPFKAELPELQELADLSVQAMQDGYDSAVDASAQGKIIIPEAED